MMSRAGLWNDRGVVAAPGAAGLCKILEHAARQHADELGVGVDHMRSAGQAWVLVQLGFLIRKWPQPGQEVAVTTWPSPRTTGIRAWREFEIQSASGEKLAEAASVWVTLDLASRRPVQLPGRLMGLEFPERRTRVEFESLSHISGGPAWALSKRATESDLDENGHVNNVVYVCWAEQALRGQAGFHPKRLQVDFLSEAPVEQWLVVCVWDRYAGRRFVEAVMHDDQAACLLQWW